MARRYIRILCNDEPVRSVGGDMANFLIEEMKNSPGFNPLNELPWELRKTAQRITMVFFRIHSNNLDIRSVDQYIQFDKLASDDITWQKSHLWKKESKDYLIIRRDDPIYHDNDELLRRFLTSSRHTRDIHLPNEIVPCIDTVAAHWNLFTITTDEGSMPW